MVYGPPRLTGGTGYQVGAFLLHKDIKGLGIHNGCLYQAEQEQDRSDLVHGFSRLLAIARVTSRVPEELTVKKAQQEWLNRMIFFASFLFITIKLNNLIRRLP